MAVRHGTAYNIVKKDIKTNVILKHYDGVSEWWIYRKKESRFVDATGKNLKQGEKYLYCIILSDSESNGKRQENEDFIAVEGYKITNDEQGKDLTKYLSNTGRAL